MIFQEYADEISRYSRHSDRMIGVVVGNADPKGKSRVQVAIPSFTDKIAAEAPELMPWYPIMSEINQYQVEIPTVGTRVLVDIYDVYNALVVGSLVSIPP